MRKENLKNNLISQKGNVVIFFVLFVIPTLTFLFVLAFDVTALYTKKRNVQKILDEACLEGVKFYPYKSYALDIAKNYLLNYGLKSNDFKIVADNVGINIDYNKDYRLVFSNLTELLTAGKDTISYPIRAYSYAVPSVNDVLLLLDRNFYNAPEDKKDVWGNEGNWPSATYLTENDDEFFHPDDFRYYTQQCFNEVFLPLKKYLIDVYNFYGSSSLNSVGVGVFPGNIIGKNLELIKDIEKVSFSGNEARFSNYVSDEGVQNTLCYNMAINERATEKYKFPKINEEYKVININKDEDINTKQSSLVTSIWSTPVCKEKYSGEQFYDILELSIRYLMSTHTRTDRHTSSEKIIKTLIIFSSRLPDKDFTKMKTMLNNLNSLGKEKINRINIIYALYVTGKINTFNESDVSVYKQFFKDYNNNQDNIIKLYLVSNNEKNDEESYFSNIHNFILLNKKEGSIWR